jgi:hypothetical protein
MDVLLAQWNEKVVLQQSRHCGIPETIRENYQYECKKSEADPSYFAETSTRTGFDKLARCNLATLVVMVAENK